MKNHKIKNEELCAIGVFFLIDICSKLLAKMLGVGIVNTGMSFGLFSDVSGTCIYFIDLGIVILLWVIRRIVVLDRVSRTGFILMLSGVLGNFIWRILFGHVLEWIDLLYIPTFNIADIMIILGGVITIFGIVWHGVE